MEFPFTPLEVSVFIFVSLVLGLLIYILVKVFALQSLIDEHESSAQSSEHQTNEELAKVKASVNVLNGCVGLSTAGSLNPQTVVHINDPIKTQVGSSFRFVDTGYMHFVQEQGVDDAKKMEGSHEIMLENGLTLVGGYPTVSEMRDNLPAGYRLPFLSELFPNRNLAKERSSALLKVFQMAGKSQMLQSELWNLYLDHMMASNLGDASWTAENATEFLDNIDVWVPVINDEDDNALRSVQIGNKYNHVKTIHTVDSNTGTVGPTSNGPFRPGVERPFFIAMKNYENNEDETMVFDSGDEAVTSWVLHAHAFQFASNDELKMYKSTDGTLWDPVYVKWMRFTEHDRNRNTFPASGANLVATFGASRFLKFVFSSNPTTTMDGWDMTLTSLTPTTSITKYVRTIRDNLKVSQEGSIEFHTDKQKRWEISHEGHLLPVETNVYDIGNAGYKIRDIFENQ